LIVEPLSALYGAAATWRRRWYARDPSRQRRLTRPVLSVGNLRVGGTGKTPVVGCLARLLAARGERPSILSRGYARQRQVEGVTVVSDGLAIRADLATSGDEPMLLARAHPDVPVLVSADRYLAGRLAEERFGVTVHLLDDGFQHLQLARDVDLLLVDEHDLSDRVLPAGRLREPVTNAAVADAVLVTGADAAGAAAVAARLGVARGWSIVRTLGEARAYGHVSLTSPLSAPVFAMAGIARPERFFDDLARRGVEVRGTRAFRDHHAFRQHDVDLVVSEARASGAASVVTTEKDGVRLTGLDLSALPFATVPLHVRIEPADEFADWILGRLAAARAHGGTAR
jgi:tetraacyldisaccharide 4'-kinase